MRNTETPNRHALVAAITAVTVGVTIVVSARAAGDIGGAESAAWRTFLSPTTVADHVRAAGAGGIHFNGTSMQRFEFSTFAQNNGALANELNVASNGSWIWGPEVTAGGADRYVVTVTAPLASMRDNYFWASVFDFSNHQNGGYIGLQTSIAPIGGARGGIFSIWDTTVAEAVDGGIAQPFGGEGVGMQTARAMAWEWDTEFELIAEKDMGRSDGQFNWWRGFIVGKDSGAGIEVGHIRSPAAWGHPVPNTTFLERYGESNACGEFERAGGQFTDVRARVAGQEFHPTGVRVELREYDDCGGVVRASRLDDGYSVAIDPGTSR
jgi:hypothetical protein